MQSFLQKKSKEIIYFRSLSFYQSTKKAKDGSGLFPKSPVTLKISQKHRGAG